MPEEEEEEEVKVVKEYFLEDIHKKREGPFILDLQNTKYTSCSIVSKSYLL